MTVAGRRIREIQISQLVGPLLAVATLIVYTRTLAPSLGGTIDSAEFQQATYSLSVVHPTGYPLYLLLGRLWITLFPFGDAAFRINLLSAIFSALSVWVLYATVRALTGSMGAGVAAGALFAVQPIPWAQAGVAEINSFNTLLTGLAFFAAILWGRGQLPLAAFALVVGMAVSHHRTMLLYLPLLVLFMLAAWRWGAPRKATLAAWVVATALLLLPQTLYLYLPLRAYTSPWYHDCCNSWEAFRATVFGQSALPVIKGALGRPLLPRFKSVVLGDIFSGAPGLWLVLPGIAGLSAAFVPRALANAATRKPRLFAATSVGLFLAAFGIGAAFASLYDILDISDYLAVPIYMWCVLVGLGVSVLVVATRKLRAAHAYAPRAALGVIGVVMGVLWTVTAARSITSDEPRVDFSSLDRRAFWGKVQAESANLPRNAQVIADWPEANEARYLQVAEGWRPDLRLSVVDDVLGNDAAPVKTMLASKDAVFLVGEQQSLLSRFSATRFGPLWHLTGVQAERPIPPMRYKLNRRYGDNIILLGYTLEPDPPVLQRGGLLNVTLYWKATAPVTERYVIFNHIINAGNTKIGQKDDEPGHGALPTIYWKPGQIVADTFPVALDPDAAPGTYRLMTGLYPRQGPARLSAFSSEGTPLGDYPELAEITVR